MKHCLRGHVSHAALAACLVFVGQPAIAQVASGAQAEAPSNVEAVVVTARKRQESDISVPVALTAISSQQIERQAILNLYDVAQRTPTLSINNTGTGIGGGVFLRGIGTAAASSNSLDQSISFDIDGVPISRGNVLRVGEYDLDQIEVLKGPQALFFGKNSPAGVLSFKSKDPTSELELSGKVSYEPYANYRFGEVIVSGPISESFRGRLFARTAKSDGEKDNLAALALPSNAIVPGAVWAPSSDKAWGFKDTFFRGTLIFEPNTRFKARLTSSYDLQDGDGVGSLKERFYCPRGVAQNGTAANLLGGGANAAALASLLAVDDCKLNGTVYQGNINPAQLSAPSLPSRDPDGITKSRIAMTALQIDYGLTDKIDLASVTAYARLSELSTDHFSYGPPSVAALQFYGNVLHAQFSQELRLTSNFDTPLNFMVGGFYQDTEFRTLIHNYAVPPYNIFQFNIPNQVYSVFGQGLWDITEHVELAAGARLTKEKKSLLLTRDGVPQITANPSATFKDTSPEATLTWRPNSDLTAYVAYKSGFKSGGYAATLTGNGPPLPTTAPLRDFLYQPESAEGFEVGLKTALLGRTLRLDTSIYSYEYGDLQVSNVNTATGAPVLRVFNAATARQRGIEVEGSYYPPQVAGLRISGVVNYNKSYYAEFESPCYIGQSIAEGCNLNPAGGVFTAQDLSGKRFTNAPLWVGSLGFSYGKTIDRLRLEFGSDVVHRSSYNATAELSPGGVQKASTTLSAQVRLMAENRGWEIGVFGKNLTDVYRALENGNAPLTGNSAATGTANGGVMARADLMGNTTPGRAVFIQLTIRPSAWIK